MSGPYRTNGRPEPEVIVNFADGLAYSKGKMDEAFKSGVLEKPSKVITKDPAQKKEDVDLIVNELEITRAKAEKALAENAGDVKKALETLTTPSAKQ